MPWLTQPDAELTRAQQQSAGSCRHPLQLSALSEHQLRTIPALPGMILQKITRLSSRASICHRLPMGQPVLQLLCAKLEGTAFSSIISQPRGSWNTKHLRRPRNLEAAALVTHLVPSTGSLALLGSAGWGRGS